MNMYQTVRKFAKMHLKQSWIDNTVKIVRKAIPFLPVKQVLPDGNVIWRHIGDMNIPRIMEEIYIEKVYDDVPDFGPRKGENVLDIGAHIGLYTLQTARIVGAKGSVIAVEADPKTFNLLERNAKLSDDALITCVKTLLWSEPKELVFHRDPSGFGSHSAVFERGGQKVRMQAQSLDSLVKTLNITKVSLIKLDVEGAALEVLKGGTGTLKRWKPRIICAAYHTSEESQLVSNFLKSLDYDPETREIHLSFSDEPEIYIYAK
jgi:FkbM family methyltransferase